MNDFCSLENCNKFETIEKHFGAVYRVQARGQSPIGLHAIIGAVRV